jgi:hypothetical protein
MFLTFSKMVLFFQVFHHTILIWHFYYHQLSQYAILLTIGVEFVGLKISIPINFQHLNVIFSIFNSTLKILNFSKVSLLAIKKKMYDFFVIIINEYHKIFGTC